MTNGDGQMRDVSPQCVSNASIEIRNHFFALSSYSKELGLYSMENVLNEVTQFMGLPLKMRSSKRRRGKRGIAIKNRMLRL